MTLLDPDRREELEILFLTAKKAEKDPLPCVRLCKETATFLQVLESAMAALQNIEAETIVLAASPNRFNDAFTADWRAVRVDDWVWDTHRLNRKPTPQEFRLWFRDQPAHARVAYNALQDLEKAGWRDLYATAIHNGTWGGDSLFLVRQSGLFWLVFAVTNGWGADHVFALWDSSQPLRYFGEAVEKFDFRMYDTPALRFQMEDGGKVVP